MADDFPTIRLKGKLRPSQAEVIEIAKKKLKEGKHQLHIVAPPGSGKTILGLVLWAECVKKPALVLSPNSAIQSQWASKTGMFEFSVPTSGLISIEPTSPGILTSLTYQSVTMPKRGGDDLDAQAIEIWKESLIEKGQAQDPDEAQVWIDGLEKHNRNYYEQRLSAYRKQVRDVASIGGDSLKMLHGSSLATLERLKDNGLGLIIFDECHHLMEHWGRVLADAHEMLGDPIIIGLTATPPDRDGKNPKDVQRYDEFFGEVDYEVPVPAVVKDGFLAPYQDLAYFVRPSMDELSYVAKADEQLLSLVDELCGIPEVEEVETNETVQPPPSVVNPKDPASEAVKPVTRVIRPRANDLDSSPAPGTPSSTSEENTATQKQTPELPTEPIEPNEPPPIPVKRANNAKNKNSKKEQPSGREALTTWLLRVITEFRLPTGVMKDWATFERRDTDFANAARLFLLKRDIPLPPEVPAPLLELPLEEMPLLPILVPVIDRFVRHRLRVSQDDADRELAEQAIRRLRMLGVQITETGCQACASPVGRVMAYSRSKVEALAPILKAEFEVLGDKMRAVVVADYEKTSAITAEIRQLLDDEAGGAVAAFKSLLKHPATDKLNPILVTGSSVLIDDDLGEQFAAAARAWLRKEGFEAQLEFGEEDGFHVLNGSGTDWCPRVYVAMITELFQQGLTKCLVGTRGLLGEGWDANKINVLIDLTTVTTSMTVNQLRGRSIRLDPEDPKKLADNWDIVCLAPEFSKGLDDYKRFMAKHQTLYGVTDDGAVEKGVGHVHPAFTELKPEGVENNVDSLNDEMLERVKLRDDVRNRWKIGQPYQGEPKRAVEAKVMSKKEREKKGFPPFAGSKTPWSDVSLAQSIGQAIASALYAADLIRTKPELHVAARSGGYVRMFLESAEQEENELFTKSLHEALASLDQRPRYIIPRDIVRIEQTPLGSLASNVLGSGVSNWLATNLPKTLSQRLEKRTRERAMYHAVPSCLAKNKETVEIFQKFWNKFVSPGEAVFGHRSEGEAIIDRARQKGLAPSGAVHQKDIFL